MELTEQHNQTLIISVSSLLLSLCFASFALRLWSRKIVKVPLGLDDWSMVAVLLVCTAMSTSDLVGVKFGSGEHAYNLSKEDLYHFQINIYVFMLLWTAGTTSVRLSILFFYWRVFSVRTFRRALIAACTIVACGGLAMLLSFAFQCSPPSHFWNETSAGTCVSPVPFYLASGSVSLLEDIMVLTMPMPVLWHLKATMARKMALSMIFALGGFVCVTSIFRIVAIKKIDPNDFTWSNVEGGIWSTIEVEVGCICANLVHLRPIFSRFLGSSRTKRATDPDISMEAGWSRRRGEGFEEIAELSSRTKRSDKLESEVELDGKESARIMVQTVLSQGVEERLPTEHEERGHLTTNVYGQH